MITVRELAAEVDATDDDVFAVLSDIQELALSCDSKVRDDAADIVRARLRNRSGTSRASVTDESSVTAVGHSDLVAISLQRPRAAAARSTRRRVRRGETRDKSLCFLLEQHVRLNSDRSVDRDRDFFYPGEFEAAQKLRSEWVRESLDQGVPLEDDDIHAWLVTFPDQVLSPRSVLPLILHGLKPHDVKLRLWFGRENRLRPTLFERIGWGDLSTTEAAEQIAQFRRRTGA